jgi:hypothetical protein
MNGVSVAPDPRQFSTIHAWLTTALEATGQTPRDVALMMGMSAILVTNRPRRETTRDALSALRDANTPPSVFVRSAELVCIQIDEKQRPVIRPLVVCHSSRAQPRVGGRAKQRCEQTYTSKRACCRPGGAASASPPRRSVARLRSASASSSRRSTPSANG